MDKDLFTRHEALRQKGIIIGVVAINQISNGNESLVKKGMMPTVTFTVEVMDESLEDLIYNISCDSFEEALQEGVEYAEKNLISNQVRP
ncbi:hypothetical protein [Paenibacillus polymyxa]|uniref:Uncharacterized protein n=1 Tax=Paenibacillus polymyxa (strain SC2) TaxID=886882 RepID=E3EJZ5_PAEPS|nr:hypothetical protein [Paenibacillus polymyxa]ADO60014.1 hypothetical protein PPSC2_28110 [Paenibacillus polymyxa SC2]WPQ59769.1 hypothetical protein SKN87_26125 [Paenibacillus polymyxa]